MYVPILVHNSPNIVSGLADGAFVNEDNIMASHERSRGLSIGQGCVVKVDEEDI